MAVSPGSLVVSICDFGAVGNANFYNGVDWFADAAFTIPSTDDSAAIQACVTYCADNFRTVWIPSGTPFLVKSKITVPRAFSMHGEMPSPSEIFSQAPHRKGSVIVSAVPSDYTFEMGVYEYYERGMDWRDFRLFTANPTSKGTIAHSVGWDFYFQNVTYEGFLAGGLHLDYAQDGVFLNCGFIACGSSDTEAAITFGRGCNQILFDRLHIEISTYMLDMGAVTGQVTFSGCHFEISEYVLPPDASHPYYQAATGALGIVNRYSKASPIRIYGGSQDIDFSGCTFGPNTVQGNVVHVQKYAPAAPTTFDGGLEQNAPFMVQVTAQAVSFRGCWFLETSPTYSAKHIDFTTSNDCNVSDCRFDGCWTNGYSCKFSGVKLANTTFTFSDQSSNYIAPYNRKFYGILFQNAYCTVDNVTFLSVALGVIAPKNEGYLLACIGPALHKIGSTKVLINSRWKHHNAGAAHAGPYAPTALAAAGGTLDLEFYDFNVLFSLAAPLTAIINPSAGQVVKITNNGATTSVTHTNVVKLKGSVPAAVPVYGMLTLQENISGVLVEESRNF